MYFVELLSTGARKELWFADRHKNLEISTVLFHRLDFPDSLQLGRLPAQLALTAPRKVIEHIFTDPPSDRLPQTSTYLPSGLGVVETARWKKKRHSRGKPPRYQLGRHTAGKEEFGRQPGVSPSASACMGT
jgi:hypothetical protein